MLSRFGSTARHVAKSIATKHGAQTTPEALAVPKALYHSESYEAARKAAEEQKKNREYMEEFERRGLGPLKKDAKKLTPEELKLLYRAQAAESMARSEYNEEAAKYEGWVERNKPKAAVGAVQQHDGKLAPAPVVGITKS